MTPLLTTKQVAEILGKDRHAVGQYVRDGLLAVVKLPGNAKPRFTQEAVADFVKRCEVAPKLPPVIETEVRQPQQKRPPVNPGQVAKSESEPPWYEKYAKK